MGSIKYPTIDFFDPNSLATWLEARKIAQEMGMRFNSRLDHVTGIYIITSAILMSLTLLYLGGYAPFLDYLPVEQLIQVFVITFVMHVHCFRMIIPIALINEEVINQIKKLNRIRSIIFRFVINPQQLRLYSVEESNKIR